MAETDQEKSESRGHDGSKLLKVVMVALIVAVLLVSPLSLLSNSSSENPYTPAPARIAYTSHATISINGNSQFTNGSGVVWGSGIASDPYIISGWDIDATPAHGIDIQNTNAYFIVRNCHVHDGWHTYGGIHLTNCVNGILSDNICDSNNNWGILLSSSNNNMISNNTCSGNNYGLGLYSSSNNTLIINTCSNIYYGIVLSASSNNNLTDNTCNSSDYGIVLTASTSNNNLTDNTCNSNDVYGIVLSTSSNNNLTDNTCNSNDVYGMYLESSSNNNILFNNTCSNNLGQGGMRLNSSDGNTISNNTILNNMGDGISNVYSDGTIISGNTCSSNITAAGGICIYYCYGNIISNNNCSSNNNLGIQLYTSSGNTISGNNCSDNLGSGGIFLYGGSGHSNDNNNISRNRVFNNIGYGVQINTGSGSNNMIWNNTFIGNNGVGVQAYDDGTNNRWNTSGSPHGYGNYWDDLTTPDNDFDGIVDWSYNLTGTAGAKDWYPLTTPPAPSFPGIRINSNSEFASMVASWGWPGDGTPGNPYVISGYDIDATGYPNAIYVGNTTVHFVVRDCFITNSSVAGIELYNCVNGTLINNSCSNNDYGIYLYSSSSNTISNNTCGFNSEYGILLYISSNNNTISNNTCSSNTQYSIILSSSSNNTLNNNTCLDNQWGIVLTASSNYNTLNNNTCNSNTQYGIYLYSSSSNTLITNTCSSNNDYGIYLNSSSSNNTISNNICSNSYYYGILLYISSNNNTLINNTCSNNWAGIYLCTLSNNNIVSNNNCSNNDYGIYLYSSSDNTISSNNCGFNSNFGIHLNSSSNNNTLNNNTCSNNYYYGILLYISSNNNTLINNTCNSNTQYGIFLISSGNNTLISNNCSSSSGYGIRLGSSSNNTLNNNICNSNTEYGIYLEYLSDNNTIAWNQVCNNTLQGVYIESGSDDNRIWNNTFTGNNGGGVQAYDDGTNNRWNTSGSPHGYGNDWSDWMAPDNNRDGIVDNPYDISGSAGAKDYYPLTSYSDSIAPTTAALSSGTVGTNGWFTSDASVSLSATDAGSGVNATFYRIGTSGSWLNYSSSFLLSSEGISTVQFYSMDNASNNETVKSVIVKIDKTPPAGTIVIQGGAAFAKATAVTLSLIASDDASGIEQFRLSNDGVTWGSWESWQNLSASIDWTLPSGDGQKKIFFQIMDNASNVATSNDTITLDTIPPTFAFGIANGVDFTGSSATINWSDTDANGIIGYEYSLDGGAFVSCGLTTHVDLSNLTVGSHNLTVRAIDGAGNVAEKTVDFSVSSDSSSQLIFGMDIIRWLQIMALIAGSIMTFIWRSKIKIGLDRTYDTMRHWREDQMKLGDELEERERQLAEQIEEVTKLKK